jgi:hypothetical protein
MIFDTVFLFGRSQYSVVAMNKRRSILPSQSQHSEPVEISLGAMIVDFGEKLHLRRTAPIMGGSLQYQDLLPLCLRERFQETLYDHLGQKPDQATPIMPVSAEKSLNSVFSHTGSRILMDPGEDVFTHKRPIKDSSENQKWFDISQLPNPGLVKKRGDFKLSHESVDPISKILIL